MSSFLSRLTRVELAPPAYLSMPTAGIDISTSGIKVALVKEHPHGLELATYGEALLPPGAVTGGEISDQAAVVSALTELASKHRIRFGNIALSEGRSYLFQAGVTGKTPSERRIAVEQRLDEYVPLPPAEVAFDLVPIGESEGLTNVAGVGYARRIIDESLGALDGANIQVRSVESETFSLPRAVLPNGSAETVLIIDLGRTATKLVIVESRIPLFATTLDIGGHALTLAVQKYFGVTEQEAKRVKAEKGIVAGGENAEYLAAMLSTVSVLREEILKRFEYWQSRSSAGDTHKPITRAILVGGNASVRGLPEYLETALSVPVEHGDVFINFARKDTWLPPIDFMESLAYATAIGLSLREYVD